MIRRPRTSVRIGNAAASSRAVGTARRWVMHVWKNTTCGFCYVRKHGCLLTYISRVIPVMFLSSHVVDVHVQVAAYPSNKNCV